MEGMERELGILREFFLVVFSLYLFSGHSRNQEKKECVVPRSGRRVRNESLMMNI